MTLSVDHDGLANTKRIPDSKCLTDPDLDEVSLAGCDLKHDADAFEHPDVHINADAVFDSSGNVVTDTQLWFIPLSNTNAVVHADSYRTETQSGSQTVSSSATLARRPRK